MKNFTEEDFSLFEFMDKFFIRMLDEFATQVGHRITIHAAAKQAGHTTNSQHYKRPCRAVDLSCGDLELKEFLRLAQLFQFEGQVFKGIGIYPYWNNPGLHLDLRERPIKWIRNVHGAYLTEFTLCDLDAHLLNSKLGFRETQKGFDFCSGNH